VCPQAAHHHLISASMKLRRPTLISESISTREAATNVEKPAAGLSSCGQGFLAQPRNCNRLLRQPTNHPFYKSEVTWFLLPHAA